MRFVKMLLPATKWILNVTFCLYIAGCGNRASHSTEDTSAGNTAATPPAVADNGPQFKKEGELSFISKANNDTLRKIDIEIAETDDERAQGLMRRRSMSDEQGMLFIFSEAAEQSFWMKDTYISLDIIYVDDKKEIVSIQKYTTPQSEESLPSYKKAQYVVEVNAGFCDKYHIAFGDRIAFTRQP
jgi:uncharacterized membrane protein (UPF0127 family)